jgi:hypothetical protein
MMRLPTISKPLLDELLSWAKRELPDAIESIMGEDARSVVSSEDCGLRESRRQRRNRSSVKGGTKRRRGVRKWVVGSINTDATTATDGNKLAIPNALHQLFEWLLRGLQQVSTVDAGASHSEPWRNWVKLPLDDLIAATLVDPNGEFAILHSLVLRVIQILLNFPAHSSRNETLHWLFTATIWYMKGPLVARAYIEHLLIPQVFACAISGIPRVTGMTLHLDEGSGEWYISTLFIMSVTERHNEGNRRKQLQCTVQHSKWSVC